MSSLKIRIGAGLAAVVTAAFAAVSTPSPAAAAALDLSVHFGIDVAEVDNGGTHINAWLYNYGDADASGVTVTFDFGDLRDVDPEMPDYTDSCEEEGAVVTCNAGVLPAGGGGDVFIPFYLTSEQGAEPGPAGKVTTVIKGTAPDGSTQSNTVELPVTIVASGADLVALADDLNTPEKPVGPGDVLPIPSGIFNEGDSTAKGWFVRIQLTTGATFVEEYEDCTYDGIWPGEHPEGYVYGPSQVLCTAPDVELPAGQGLLFADPETGESLFNATFGKNLRGPEQLDGMVEVGLIEDLANDRAARTARKGKGTSFADAVAALQTTSRSKALRELDTEDNVVWFNFWSKANSHDFSVTTTPVSGAIGETVKVPFTVVNNGPSDGAAGWTFVAPAGTVFVPGETNGFWCYFHDESGAPVDELRTVGCSNESEWPSTASGRGVVQGTMTLRIDAAPGNDGTLTVRPYGAPTELNPDNNVAKLVVTVGDGGSGGGLPVTGAKAGVAAGVGAAVLALGAVLFVVARRRRIVTVAD